MRSVNLSGLIRFIFASVLVHAAAVVDAGEIKGAEIRALIDGQFGITRETYVDYQACLARIGLSQELAAVVAARKACKDAAINRSFLIPAAEAPSSPTRSPRPATTATAPPTAPTADPAAATPSGTAAEAPGIGSKESRSVWQSDVLKRAPSRP